MKFFKSRRAALGAALFLLAGAALAAKQVYNFKGGVKTRADQGLTKAELAPLPDQGGFDTWTYTFMLYLDDDSSAMIQFTHWKLYFLSQYGLLFSFIDKGEQQYLRKPIFPAGEVEYLPDPPGLRMGANYWKGFYPDFYLHIDLPAKSGKAAVAADLHLHCRTPGWRPGAGPVHYGAPEGEWYDLVVMIPWADLDGTVTIGNKTRKVKGWGYSDHNTQTVLPTSQLGRILALRSFSEDYSINFLEYVAPEDYNHERTTWLLIMKGGRILFATDKWEREMSDYVTEPTHGYKYPTRMSIKIDQPGCKLEGEIRGVKFIELIDALDELPSFIKPVAERFIEASVCIRQNAVVKWRLVMPEQGIDDRFTCKGVFEATIVK